MPSWITIREYLFKFFHLQLFLSLVSWPILVWWGLPFSLLSFVGNLIFSPLLFIFLMISSLIIITELLCIPNAVIIWFLEKLVILWNMIIKQGSSAVLLYMPRPSWYIALSVSLLTLLIPYYYTQYARKKSLLYLMIVAMCWTSYGYYLQKKTDQCIKIPCGRSAIVATKTGNKLTILDNGTCTKSGTESWVNYKLLPMLSTEFGTVFIDNYTCERLTKSAYERISYLVEKGKIQCIECNVFCKRSEYFQLLQKFADNHKILCTYR